MDNKENLNFKITLGATFWDKLPEYSVSIDDTLIKTDTVDNSGTSIIEFNHELTEGKHLIKIRLNNKEDSDTVVEEDGTLTKDMLLNINDITIDSVSLGDISAYGTFYIDGEKEFQGKTVTSLDGCHNIGWNGCYVLEISSPFHMWLLENS